jgi:pyridoxamine 5'-phosphate oxidase
LPRRSASRSSPDGVAQIELRRRDLDPDPLRQFERWWAEAAVAAHVPERVALATASADGAPSLRMVLLKSFDDRGLVFFTHTTSRKGRELAANPRAALLLYWRELGRQVRVEGTVAEVPADESDAYFATRPAGARAGAAVSRQSEVLESRAALEAAVAAVGPDPQRPETWGGYRVAPAAWEFWQHRDDRLHDRFRYTRGDGGWAIDRLYP